MSASKSLPIKISLHTARPYILSPIRHTVISVKHLWSGHSRHVGQLKEELKEQPKQPMQKQCPPWLVWVVGTMLILVDGPVQDRDRDYLVT